MISTGFRSLDGAIGGLTDKKDYLIYGPVGSCKSGFALSFLHAGLTAGEVAVLVTRRLVRRVLDHSHIFGWDFEPFLFDSQLIVLEYTPKILQTSAGLSEEIQVMSELFHLLEGAEGKRIEFDPLTSILEGTINTNIALRCRTLWINWQNLARPTFV